MEGHLVSHYRVLAQVGGGGMGVVYRAEDTRLKRSVALKFLPPDLTRDSEARARFIQEAQAASALDHPNICTIYDIDDTGADAGGRLFIVMACYEGGTLKDRLARGVLPVNLAIEIAMQIARGLDQAHEAGIVHRDIKPANVMFTREAPEGVVKIVDFGVAKLMSVDVTGMTRAGVSLGTPAYMAPEQIEGRPVDRRADLWALGVVLYEMVTGRLPFGGDTPLSITHAIVTTAPVPVPSLRPEVPAALDAVIRRALAKRPEDRYGSARELLRDLEAVLPSRVTAIADATTPMLPRERAMRLGWTRLAVAAGMVALAAAGGTIAWLLKRGADERRVDALVVEITAAADADEYNKALGQLEELERRASGDPRLAALEQRIAVRSTITTQPDGATVSVKPYAEPAATWRPLGRTPIADVRLGRGLYRWRLEKEGYATLEVPNPGSGRGLPPLPRADTQPPNTILLRPQPLFLTLAGYDFTRQLPGGSFLIDKYEVTNRQYKVFVDAGGYARREYWAAEFVKDGRRIPWEEARAEFRDSTGRPGPATWEVGAYPVGQDDYPLSGVSWYEADAFARFSGRSLPTVYHWVGAAGTFLAANIAPLSNMNGKGPAPVGQYAGMSVSGAYDMAGNVKEWCANSVENGDSRYLLGGSWRDPEHAFTFADARAPFDRSPDNGLRLATYLDTPAPTLAGPIRVATRDFDAETGVPHQVFDVFRAMFAYDPRPVDAKIEARDESDPRWIKETVSFRAAYGDERVPAVLFLPKSGRPPYQAVVFAPGASAVTGVTSTRLQSTNAFDFLPASGRAVLYPVYSGTYERNRGQTTVWPEMTRAYRDWIVQVINDGRRGLDYLQSRDDIERDALGYVATSWGSSVAPFALAVEARYRAAALMDGGISQETKLLPEMNIINYLPHVTTPTLLVSGTADFIFPPVPSQQVFFSRLGTPPQQKRHVSFPGGHFIVGQQRNQVVREVLDWLDRHLGPVGAKTATR